MQLDDALHEWRSWVGGSDGQTRLAGTQPMVVEHFTAGLNHSTAKISCDGVIAVLKVFHSPAESEIVAQKWASQIGVAPQILYADPQSRYAVMEFVAGVCTASDTVNKQTLYKLGDTLRRAHSADDGPVSREGFDISRFCERYLKHAGPEATSLHQRIVPILDEFQRDTTPWCFCHNDLVAANILVNNDRVTLIDWEFADQHNPWFDLAAVVYYLSLDREQSIQLLSAYNRFPLSVIDDRVFTVSQIALLWGDMLWHLAKFGDGFWSELGKKRSDLLALVSRLNPSGV